MILEDLSKLIRALFFIMVLLLIAAFLFQVLASSDVLGQVPTPVADAHNTPTAVPTRSWATTAPVFTSTPPPGAPTPTLTPTPSGPAPIMDVSCRADYDAWLCDVWVYPGRITGLEILAVHNFGFWTATFEYLGSTSDGWGVVVRWENMESCSGEFAELQLMELDPMLSTTARIQQIQSPSLPPPSPTHARHLVSWYCSFLSEIH